MELGEIERFISMGEAAQAVKLLEQYRRLNMLIFRVDACMTRAFKAHLECSRSLDKRTDKYLRKYDLLLELKASLIDEAQACRTEAVTISDELLGRCDTDVYDELMETWRSVWKMDSSGV